MYINETWHIKLQEVQPPPHLLRMDEATQYGIIVPKSQKNNQRELLVSLSGFPQELQATLL